MRKKVVSKREKQRREKQRNAQWEKDNPIQAAMLRDVANWRIFDR